MKQRLEPIQSQFEPTRTTMLFLVVKCSNGAAAGFLGINESVETQNGLTSTPNCDKTLQYLEG